MVEAILGGDLLESWKLWRQIESNKEMERTLQKQDSGKTYKKKFKGGILMEYLNIIWTRSAIVLSINTTPESRRHIWEPALSSQSPCLSILFHLDSILCIINWLASPRQATSHSLKVRWLKSFWVCSMWSGSSVWLQLVLNTGGNHIKTCLSTCRSLKAIFQMNRSPRKWRSKMFKKLHLQVSLRRRNTIKNPRSSLAKEPETSLRSHLNSVRWWIGWIILHRKRTTLHIAVPRITTRRG